jgi:type II secretory pathway predicted ATPase ExeA
MYYSHFGLSQAPFKITPNTEFFFTGGNRGPILEALIYAVTHGEGIIKVTGEVGSGKTMLCHMLPTRLPPHIVTAYIANPSVSPEEILRAIAFELQLDVSRSAARLEVMQALHDYLIQRHAEGKRVVIFVEESQSMPLATLEEIRLLSNLETKNDKLLQIVLFGQPEIDDHLRQPIIRPLRERITHSFRLEPLVQGEIREYLMFRLRAAGYRGPDLFSNSVVSHIARSSQGLTRRVNLIADKALLAAFAENTHTIRPKHIQAAVRDSEFSQQLPRRARPPYLWGSALVASGAALGIAAYILVGQGIQNPRRNAAATEPQSPVGSSASQSQLQPPVVPATSNQGIDSLSVSSAEAQSMAPHPPVKVMTNSPSSRSGSPAQALPQAGATETAVSGHADLLEVRLAATAEWLKIEANNTYSIQILGTNDPEQLRVHLNDLVKFIEINKVFVYLTTVNRRPFLTMLYGSFSDRRLAQEVLNKLPERLKANRPILRTVEGVRAEISLRQAL